MEILSWVQEFPFITDVPIILVVFWMIVTGRLVPKRTVDALLSGRDAQIADWKLAYETRGELAGELIAQNDKMLESNSVTQHLLQAIIAKAEEGQP